MSRWQWIAAGGVVVLAAAIVALWTPDRPWATLESRWLKYRADLWIVEGTRLHVRDEGPRDAPALVLIHGLGSSLQTWDTWAVVLREHWRVIRLDLPGHGLSGPDSTGDYRDARTHALLTALLDRLDLRTATLVGHSIGGRIAWSYAAVHPDRVHALVLVAPDGFASPGFEYGRAPSVPSVMAVMEVALPRFVLKANLAPAFHDPAALDESRKHPAKSS